MEATIMFYFTAVAGRSYHVHIAIIFFATADG